MNEMDFSFLSLFATATPVVKSVLIILAAASALCWAVIAEKAIVLARLRRQAALLEASGPTGADDGLATSLRDTAQVEAARQLAGEAHGERRERIERALREALAATLMLAEQRLNHLATVGSAAPFIGLFGTVWGIMHAFTGIASRHDTSLAAVAPGIAEALAATAIGLVTAIPAAIAYNKLAGDFSLLSRRLHLAAGRLAGRLVLPEYRA